MNLNEITKAVQRATPGVGVDGVPGMQTMLGVYHYYLRQGLIGPEVKVPDDEQVIMSGEAITALNARTLKNIATLDPKARDRFIDFAGLAQATAATYGCEYVMISGYRTWDEQAELYRACQAGGPHAVPAGYSMHNYRLAGDFGVFRDNGKTYLDGGSASQQALAEKIHHACAIHAAACGLIAGSTWTGRSHDDPHFQIDIGHATPTDADRAKFQSTGSIL